MLCYDCNYHLVPVRSLSAMVGPCAVTVGDGGSLCGHCRRWWVPVRSLSAMDGPGAVTVGDGGSLSAMDGPGAVTVGDGLSRRGHCRRWTVPARSLSAMAARRSPLSSPSHGLPVIATEAAAYNPATGYLVPHSPRSQRSHPVDRHDSSGLASFPKVRSGG